MELPDDLGPASNGHAASGAPVAPAAGREPLAIFLHLLEELRGSVDGLLAVHADRLRLSMRRTLVRGAIGAGVALCAAVWLGAATLAVLRGTCAGFTALWGGRAWLGELTGGSLALALAAAAIALHLQLSARRRLARLKAKYERIRGDTPPDSATRAGDGGGIPGARGSAGAPAPDERGAARG